MLDSSQYYYVEDAMADFALTGMNAL